MNTSALHPPPKTYNSGCADRLSMAERELSAFFHAVTQLFGSEQAELVAENWLQELLEIDVLPASVSGWRLITAKASTRLSSRSRTSTLSTELQTA